MREIPGRDWMQMRAQRPLLPLIAFLVLLLIDFVDLSVLLVVVQELDRLIQ
jgi:hypothetical protein